MALVGTVLGFTMVSAVLGLAAMWSWLVFASGLNRMFALEAAIGSHGCWLDANIEANTRVPNSMPLGCPYSYRLPL